MQRELSEALGVAERAARAAGRVISAAAGAQRVEHKGAVDLVTEVDLASEAAIRAVLEREAPGVPILAEEGGGAWAARTRWLVDPLDGTTNFVHGFPWYCVSVALELDGALAVGCIYDPVHDQAWTAAAGQGARRDGVPVRVSAVPTLDRALLATGFPYDRRQRAAYYTRFVTAFLERIQGVRRAGSAAMDLVLLAAGRVDGYWELNLKPWDVAAGVLLVQEAGGRVSAPTLAPLDLERPSVLASNGLIHEEMAQIMAPLLSSAPT